LGAEPFPKGFHVRQTRTNGTVKGGVMPKSGHWIMAENPAATPKLIIDFLSH